MNTDEWNSRLFVELVQQVGTPGDPLFLYVDEDVLAKCTDGQLGPTEAVEDFCNAFNTASSAARFASAARSARRWELGGFEGPPPHMDTLAMTVLAATTRPPLGFEGNIYARQRELLGIRDLDGGAPAGYADYVPGLWNAWNRWLQGPGANYGLTTASPAHFRFQGFARSQSFIRPRDKEDIYEYFAQEPYSSSSIPSPSDLLEGLQGWLKRRPSRNPRLLIRACDDDYRDEFHAFLPTSLAFWQGEKELAQQRHDLSGRLLWNPETDHLEIVVNIREVRGLAGEEVQLLDAEPYTVTSDDSYLYLYDEVTDESVWFDEAIVAWPLHERLTVSWVPRSSYIFYQLPFFGWVETRNLEPGLPYRILTETDGLPEFERLGVGSHAATANVPGWQWLADSNLHSLSLEALEELEELLHLDTSSSRRPRTTALSDGLPLGSGNRYLEGGEPDIRIGVDSSFERALIDGRDRLGELLPEVTDQQDRRLRLADLVLNPGHHTATILTSAGESNHNFTVVPPERSIGHWHRSESYQRLALSAADRGQIGFASYNIPTWTSASLVLRPGSSAFAIASNGEAFVVSTNSVAPEWLQLTGFGNEGEIETFLETSEIFLPDASQPYDLIYRRSTKSKWVVRSHPSRKPGDRFTATKTTPAQALSPALVEFLMADPKSIDTDNEAGLSNLRQSILNARAARGSTPSPLRPLPVTTHREPQPQRFDLSPGPSTAANPFNDFLDWMSEQDAGYCSLAKAKSVFGWLWSRSYPSTNEPEFTFDVLRRLQDLGHVHVDKAGRRLWIAPTVLGTLPNARSLRVLAGSRAIEFVAKLRSGDDDTAGAATSNLLQNMTFHELHQTDLTGIPIGPDIVYVQLASGSELEDHQSAAFEALGVAIETNLSVRVISSLPRLSDRIDGRVLAEIPLKSRLHTWQERQGTTSRGRWCEISRLPEEDGHFLKVNTGHSTRYAWWDSERGTLSPIDWAYGRWAFEASRSRRQLIFHKAASRQLLVAAHVPLPAEVSMALVARTGTLPRKARIRELTKAPSLALGDYNVFENISIPFAAAIADVLGQRRGPLMETNVELSFE